MIFASNRVEGFIGETGDFTIPNITVTGQSVGYGVGFAQGNFIQHNYQWRDVLTHVRGSHVLKFGYEGWFGDDVEPFQGPWSHPSFQFDNLLKLAQDAPHTQGGVMYDPITGATAAVGMERRVENVGRLRPGHLEGPAQSDGDARLPLRRSGKPVVAQRHDGLRQFLSRRRRAPFRSGSPTAWRGHRRRRSRDRRKPSIRGLARPGT